MRLELERLRLPGLAEPLSLTVRIGEVRAIVVAEPLLARALADTIAGLTAPSSGRVTVCGDHPEDGRRPARILLVPPDGALLPHLTVLRNIMYLNPVPRRRRAAEEAQIRARAAEFGLAGILDRYPYEISVGQRRMAGLARTWLCRPRPEVVVLEDARGIPTWGALLADASQRDPESPYRGHTPDLLVDVATLVIAPTATGVGDLDPQPVVPAVA